MSAAAIAPEDVIAAAGFVGVVVVAVGWTVLRGAVADSPRARIRQRLHDSVAEVGPAMAALSSDDDPETAVRPQAAEGRLAQMIQRARQRAEHMGGAAALRMIALAAVAALVGGFVLALSLGLSIWLAALLALVGGGLGGMVAFNVVVLRYRARFVAGFPDALELMIRAVRAGVPVVQAIITAGHELPHPVGREFRMMGDALRLGMDAQEVMDQASRRIGVPDFRFFVVCLQLQRETGGPLADTLENLAGIIRARREVRLKTRALTAQGRAASKIISSIPFVVMGALHFMGGGYMDVMFKTERGQHVLWLAMGLVVVGLAVISRMSRLED